MFNGGSEQVDLDLISHRHDAGNNCRFMRYYNSVDRSRCEERNLDARSESSEASNHVQQTQVTT
jgi:hypothetical protein